MLSHQQLFSDNRAFILNVLKSLLCVYKTIQQVQPLKASDDVIPSNNS